MYEGEKKQKYIKVSVRGPKLERWGRQPCHSIYIIGIPESTGIGPQITLRLSNSHYT